MQSEDRSLSTHAADIARDDATCGECAISTDRRAFLRDAALAVAGILMALGAPRGAAAMPLDIARGTRRGAKSVSYPIPQSDSAQIDRDNDIILVRWQGVVYAFNLSCPHQNTALRWNDGDHRFQCPKHHSQYRPDGTFIEGRATRGMDRLAIQRAGETVVVDPDTMYKQDENSAGWSAALVNL